MSLANDLLAQNEKLLKGYARNNIHGPELPASSFTRRLPVEGFEYTRRKSGRGSKAMRSFTWSVPLVQIKAWAKEAAAGDTVVWPWVHDSEIMMKRQVARIHNFAKRAGWSVKTARLGVGLRLTFAGKA